MSNNDMMNSLQKGSCRLLNSRVDKTDNMQLTEDNVYIVWIQQNIAEL